MAFIVKQKKHNRIYLYEATSYWNSAKKRSEQKRTYLGVWDEKTQKLIPKKTGHTATTEKVKTSKSYGDCYFFHEIIKQLQLDKVLKNNFENWQEILSLCFARLKASCSLRITKPVLEDSCLDEFISFKVPSSQRISDILSTICPDEGSFFKEWISLHDSSSVFYDITSLSSYTKQMPIFEFGYNRDGLNLPQINLGFVVSKKDSLPIYYKKFPGSISDVSTLKNLSFELKNYGVHNMQFILDQGFFSQKNIKEMISQNIDFVIPLLRSTKLFKQLCTNNNRNISHPRNVVVANSYSYYCVKRKVDYNGEKLQAKVYEDIRKKGVDLSHFYSNLELFEQTLQGSSFHGNDAEELIQPQFKKYKKHFKISIVDKKVNLQKDYSQIEKYLKYIGRIVLLSKDNKDTKQVIEHYREKDLIEKDFYSLKNYAQGIPLRVQTEETLNGILFINFISVVVRRKILNTLKPLREDKFFKKLSVQEIFIELSKLRKVSFEKEKYLTEITKTQRKILQAFKIKIPS